MGVAGCGGGEPGETDDAGAGDASADATPGTVPTDSFEFADVRCLPDVASGETVVEGQRVTCSFQVTGAVTAEAAQMGVDQVTLRCADEAGPIACGAGGEFELTPSEPRRLPIEDGSFVARTSGRADTTIALEWRVDDGFGHATHRFEAAVIPDDGVNEPPVVQFDCAGDVDGDVTVTNEALVECAVRLTDPDPDVLTWSMTQTAGPTPTDPPRPTSGVVAAPAEVAWRWQTFIPDGGATFVYSFDVSDQSDMPIRFDLAITVQ